MSKMKANKRLYEVAKAYREAALDEVFSEYDLICVRTPGGISYYVSIVPDAIAAYRGEVGLTSYLTMANSDEETAPSEMIDLQLAQEFLLAVFEDERELLEEHDREAMEASGVPFTAAFPQFRFKAQYRYPQPLSKGDEDDMILIMEALLFAKEYFSGHHKTKRSDSFTPWLESLGLIESVGVEYLPCLMREGERFTVTGYVLEDEEYGVSFPQAFFTNEERQQHFKRMKVKRGKILYYITGTMAEPVIGVRIKEPLFPVFAIAFDPQGDQILDFMMVEDYEEEHAKFVESLLNLIEQHGKMQAIHCFGRRTLPLLEKIGPQMGIMVVDGGENEQVNELIFSMFDELMGMDDHDHGPHCDHD